MKNTFTEPRKRRPCFLADHTMALIFMRVSQVYILILTSSIFTMAGPTTKGQGIENTKVKLEILNKPLKEVFMEIEKQTDFQFHAQSKSINKFKNISLPKGTYTVKEVLDLVLAGTGLKFSETKNYIIIFSPEDKIPESEKAQTESKTKKHSEEAVNEEVFALITGTVTDESTLEPLAGVNIVVKGTTKGTTSDSNGKFSIEADENDILVFSFIGRRTVEIAVNGRSIIDVTLLPETSQLEEVIVVGYGEQSKASLTSSISKVTSKDIENLPVTSFDQALQGQATGVHVASSSGMPGSPVLVRIRGQTSINAGNEPLFIVDGVPVISGGLASGTGESFGGQLNILSGVNPQDIASIEILKDAAATAIYGSRGANGVVLITTKKGSKGKTNVTLTTYAGVGEATELLDVLNAKQYLEIKREAYVNDALPIPDDLINVDASINTDWQDEIYRTANISQYQLSIDGGNENTAFYVSGSYRNEEAILKNTGLKRGTFRVNLDHNMNNNLIVGTKISFSRELNNTFTQHLGSSGPVKAAQLARPDFPVTDDSGEYSTPVILFGSFGFNPVAELLEPKFKNMTSKFIGNVYINYNFLPELRLKVDGSFDYNIFEQNIFYPSTSFTGSFSQGRGLFNLNQSGTFNIEPTILFEKEYEAHNVSVMIGSTIMKRTSTRSSIQGSNFPDDNLNFLVSAGMIFGAPNTQTFKTDYTFNSLFARINYDHKRKYLLGATFRRDGSSRFGEENRFGNFWALSAGWLFSNEVFFQNSDLLTFGKFRASYGIIGNDQLADFDNVNKWTVNPGYGGNSGIRETQLGNPELSWEETAKFDVGLELSFLRDRIGLEVDYFLHHTTGLLFSKPIPSITGFNNIISNVGETENQGIELAFNTLNIKTKGFTWNSKLNVTHVENKIVSLVDHKPIISGSTAFIVGEPINTFYGYDFLGVDPETGNAKYRDLNNDGIITSDDRMAIGNAFPELYGGFTNTFVWKGISLDVFLQFVHNLNIWDGQSNQYFDGGIDRDNQITEILHRWQAPGDITNVPRVTTGAGVGQNNFFSQRRVWDASYIRVKNVTVAYNFPSAATSKWGINKARVYVTGTNLFTITDYLGPDPEAGNLTGSSNGNANGNLPQVKMFLAGINLAF